MSDIRYWYFNFTLARHFLRAYNCTKIDRTARHRVELCVRNHSCQWRHHAVDWGRHSHHTFTRQRSRDWCRSDEHGSVRYKVWCFLTLIPKCPPVDRLNLQSDNFPVPILHPQRGGETLPTSSPVDSAYCLPPTVVDVETPLHGLYLPHGRWE